MGSYTVACTFAPIRHTHSSQTSEGQLPRTKAGNTYVPTRVSSAESTFGGSDGNAFVDRGESGILRVMTDLNILIGGHTDRSESVEPNDIPVEYWTPANGKT